MVPTKFKKFLSKSKKDAVAQPQQQPPPAPPSSSIRAHYYAARDAPTNSNNNNNNSSSSSNNSNNNNSNNNPFDSPPRPTQKNTSQNNTQNNPFDSDDDDDDDPLATFKRPTVMTSMPAPVSKPVVVHRARSEGLVTTSSSPPTTNPFESPKAITTISKPIRNTMPTVSLTSALALTSTSTLISPSASVSVNGHVNPFDDDSDHIPKRQPERSNHSNTFPPPKQEPPPISSQPPHHPSASLPLEPPKRPSTAAPPLRPPPPRRAQSSQPLKPWSKTDDLSLDDTAQTLPSTAPLLHPRTAATAGLASWLRLNKKEDEKIDKLLVTKGVKRRTKRRCKVSVVAPWPFDDFHEWGGYEEVASRGLEEYGGNGGEDDEEDGEHDDDDDDESERREERLGREHAKYYERPEELPSIKEAVNNLALIDFEKKAELRAINIISTWLFDAGLIDELLVNGAPPPSTPTTSEGIEIGSHGFPLSGDPQKIDNETNKLRSMIQRDLSIINARLNDGVAASGLEVQELVNAVSATKSDIGRLRELTTYISEGIADRNEFLLATYPRLRGAIHARRNIHRCFREYEFFSQIPSTCDRLREELHMGEWTEEEWDTIRAVAMEHVELEIMLIEAEYSMKTGHHPREVDRFLESHVRNVWELGDEIRLRMLSGIGSAFEISIQNPGGMVALVEAVEVYERATERFEKKRGELGKLRFTNMRAAALEQLYRDFELRGVEMFRGVHEQAADIAEEEDAGNAQFNAILKAATELVTEIDIVKHQMSPCFAPHWHVEALWSSCVAHVCSNHIVQQIGGPDGQNLPELTITQLLELVAWVEYFRETIEETFSEVAGMHDTKKTYFEERPDLFAGDKRTVNMRNATDSLAWVNNMLWEVHRLAQEEFLVRTRSQTDEWLERVYGSETVKNQSSEGKLTTSLCEDVFSFSGVQLRTIRERLSKKSDALILAVCVILSHMRSKQVHSRNNFLQDLETCCAASNDFTRMSEKCEDMMSDLLAQCEFSEDMIATLEASSNELMAVYSSDAVYSARSVHIYVFDPIEEEIGAKLFERAWEEEMLGNDLALSLVRTLEDFHEDLVTFMDDFMVVKSVMSLMSSTIIFYVKCLLTRAEKHRNNRKPFFGDLKTALDRMTGDIKVLREYFEGLVPKMPSLKKNIEKDFEILSTVHELMSIAAELSVSEAEDFILVLQKRVRDVGITKHIVGDLWHLVAPTDERMVWELVESMEEQLNAIAPADDALALEVNDRSYVKGLRLDEMAVKLYVNSKRVRPIKATAVESIVKNWNKTWAMRAEEGNEDEA